MKYFSLIVALLAGVLLVGCASDRTFNAPASLNNEQPVRYGSIVRIDSVALDGGTPTGAGATQAGSQVTVRLDDGSSVSIAQPADASLNVGDRVMIQGSGRDTRVMRI